MIRSAVRLSRLALALLALFGLFHLLESSFGGAGAETRAVRAQPQEPTQPEFFLLIMVLASDKGQDRRDVIRETWASALPPSTQLRFVIGGQGLSSPSAIEAEQAQHGDLLVLPRVADTYSALTNKLLHGMDAFTALFPRFRFLLKADDDTFVRVDRLVEELKQYPINIKLNWGYFDGRAPVQRKGKWAEKGWILSDKYLPYSLGGGYVLSATVVRFVTAHIDIWQQFISEDVSLGSWLAGLDLTRRHDVRFDTEWKSRGCQNKFFVTHKQTPDMMRDKHAQLLATDGQAMCKRETFVRPEYEYNWNVHPSACCPGRGNH